MRWAAVFNIKRKAIAFLENLPSSYPELTEANLTCGSLNCESHHWFQWDLWTSKPFEPCNIFKRGLSHVRVLEWKLPNCRSAEEMNMAKHKLGAQNGVQFHWFHLFCCRSCSCLCVALANAHTHLSKHILYELGVRVSPDQIYLRELRNRWTIIL